MAWQIPRRDQSFYSGDANNNTYEPWTPKESIDYFNAPTLVRSRSGRDSESRYQERTQPTKYGPPSSDVQKYSLLWFRREWKKAVKKGKWPRILYSITGILALSAWIAVALFFANEEVRYERSNDRAEQSSHSSSRLDDAGLLLLEGSLKSFDPILRSLQINWSPKYSDIDGVTKDLGLTDETTYSLGIWRDLELIPETRPIPSYINSSIFNQPIYRVDNTSAPPIAQVGRHPWDEFPTEIDLGQAVSGSAGQQPAFGFPFDKWEGSITFVANFMNLSVYSGLNNSFGFPVHDVYLVDSVLNWRILAQTNNSCEVNGNVWPEYQTVPKCELQVNLVAIRPGLVKFAAVIAVVVNWLSTICIFIMTCEGVVMRRASVIQGPQLLAVCFTALFALPSVRSILPGAPDFGALIDLIGIIPNVIVVSLCTTAVAIESLRGMQQEEAAVD